MKSSQNKTKKESAKAVAGSTAKENLKKKKGA